MESANDSMQPTLGLCKREATCFGCDRTLPKTVWIVKKPTNTSQSTPPCRSICDACRKFYGRTVNRSDKPPCCCPPSLSSSIPTTSSNCRRCRFERCHAAYLKSADGQQRRTEYLQKLASGSSKDEYIDIMDVDDDEDPVSALKTDLSPPAKKSNLLASDGRTRLDFSLLPCAVCCCPSSGIHFGVISCEGCKGFFRRSMVGSFRLEYRCKQNGKAAKRRCSNDLSELKDDESPKPICNPQVNCRKCRLKRCIDAGMSMAETAMGRLTRAVRIELEAAINTLKQSNPSTNEVDMSVSKRRKVERVQRSRNSSGAAVDPTASSSTTWGQSEEFFNPKVECTSNSPSFCDLDPLETIADVALLESTLPPSVSSPESFSSLEWSLNANSLEKAPSRCSNAITLLSSAELAKLLRRIGSAVELLRPINDFKVSVPPDTPIPEIVMARSKSFDTYVTSISKFAMALPGMNLLSIQDRVALFANAFFPILTAQLSLQYDEATGVPNHLSLERNNDYLWNVVATCNTWYLLLEWYLRKAGQVLKSTIRNSNEFALLCGCLFFRPIVASSIDDIKTVRAISLIYERALYQLLLEKSGGNDAVFGSLDGGRLGDLWQARDFFQHSTYVFHSEIRGIPTHCEPFMKVASPLFRDFRDRFMALLPDWTVMLPDAPENAMKTP